MSDLEVKNIRKNLKISQTDLARLLGISLRTVQNWEAGEKIPNTKHEMLRSLTNDYKRLKPTKEEEFEYKFGNRLHTIGIPLIPIEAMAGYGPGETQVLELDCEYFSVPTFKGADFLITVKGSSMYPKYNSGDIVACKKLMRDDVFFQWNKVYVLDTEQGALIKRIDEGPDDDHVMIVSDNEKYKPFKLLKTKINAISIVMGVIRLE